MKKPEGPSLFIRIVSVFTALLVPLVTAPVSLAGTLYWDPDGDATGNNATTGANLGGTGPFTWDSSTAAWWDGTSVTDTTWTNSSSNTAYFWAGQPTFSTDGGERHRHHLGHEHHGERPDFCDHWGNRQFPHRQHQRQYADLGRRWRGGPDQCGRRHGLYADGDGGDRRADHRQLGPYGGRRWRCADAHQRQQHHQRLSQRQRWYGRRDQRCCVGQFHENHRDQRRHQLRLQGRQSDHWGRHHWRFGPCAAGGESQLLPVG